MGIGARLLAKVETYYRQLDWRHMTDARLFGKDPL